MKAASTPIIPVKEYGAAEKSELWPDTILLRTVEKTYTLLSSCDVFCGKANLNHDVLHLKHSFRVVYLKPVPSLAFHPANAWRRTILKGPTAGEAQKEFSVPLHGHIEEAVADLGEAPTELHQFHFVIFWAQKTE